MEVKNDKVIAVMGESIGFVRDASIPLPKPNWLPEDKIPQIEGEELLQRS